MTNDDNQPRGEKVFAVDESIKGETQAIKREKIENRPKPTPPPKKK